MSAGVWDAYNSVVGLLMSLLLLGNLLWGVNSLREGWGVPWQQSEGRHSDLINAALYALLAWICIATVQPLAQPWREERLSARCPWNCVSLTLKLLMRLHELITATLCRFSSCSLTQGDSREALSRHQEST